MSHRLSTPAALRRAVPLALGVLALAWSAAPLRAQERSRRDVVLAPNGQAALTLKKKGFQLFSNADLAGTGMKMSGQHGWGLSNIGPCADGFQIFECGDIFKNGAYRFQLFEMVLYAGASVSDFRKIRSVYPGINSMLPPVGFTHITTQLLTTGRQEWGPADNSIGRLFSGATSTSDGGCRDNTSELNGYMSTGVLLLPGSNCPETWAPTGFDGPRPITDSAYIRQFQADPNNFTFDFFRIPASERDQTQFLGDFSTYGEISDHYAEIAQAYGGVTPLGSGPPAIGGYPLGLDIRFDAWSFARPQLANAVYYQMLVINNSADVYGQGVNYDSLYMGVGPGWGGAQANAVYYVPGRNALLTHQNGNVNGCNGAIILPSTPNCVANGGFRRLTDGASGVVVLKSPIGDARNRYLSREGSPFYNPTSPFADDTLTFNHGHMCGYTAICFSSTHEVNDRRGFGMISSTHLNVLDERDPATQDATEQYYTFRSKNFTGNPSAASARFNAYAPAGWDFDNDGGQDTLFLDSCADTGCVTTWSDTMPGHYVNRFSNVGGVLTAGPFKLAAGDTTAFLFAFIGSPDSVGIESLLNDVTDAYMNFFVGPQPPPVPRIVAVDVESSQQRFATEQDPTVTVYFSDEPENYTDPFLAKFAADLRAESNQFFTTLNRLNPDLADQVEERAAQNFADLWIFKSCDLGQTFTGDSDCDGDPTVGPTGALIGVGWQPYRILHADANGSIPNTFTDDNIIGGKTYLYSLVTRSRGFRASVRDIVNGDTITRELVVADTASSSLPRSGPNTVRVYVPISLPAGAQTASAVVNTVTGTSTIPVDVRLTNRAVAGQYRLVFANRFIVTTATDTVTGVVTTTVVAQDVIAQADSAGTIRTNYVTASQTFTGPGRIDFSGATPSFQTHIEDTKRVEVDTISQLGFVLVQNQLGGPARPFFISTSLTPTGSTPVAFQNRTDFPGIFVTLNQARSDSLTFERIIQTNGDTVPVSVMDAGAVQLQQSVSTRGIASGRYEFVFQQDAFGAAAPFTLQATAQQTEAQLVASLNARPTATTGSTDANLQSLSPYGAGTPLVAMKFPFTVTSSRGNQLILAAVSRADQGMDPTILLGSGADTQSVAVPADLWVPGDEFLVFEVVQRDSTAGGRTVISTTSGQPIQVTDTLLAFRPAVLGCSNTRITCNPVRLGTRGSTGYLPYQPGWKLVLNYPQPFTVASEILLDVQALRPQPDVLASSDLSRIRVVPNPYVFQSDFDVLLSSGRGDPRILFTGVPAAGTLRVYSVSGQFLQQLSWTPADLNGTGDLPYNLRTREGTDLASGLYIYVITASGTTGGKQTARGKFVVIR